MADYTFGVGETVMLKSGGPLMTVKGIGKYGMNTTRDTALCIWFDGNIPKEEVFEMATLEPA